MILGTALQNKVHTKHLEKKALVNRAQKEGVDLDELEIYIESILQQRTQEQKFQLEKETSEHEKLRKGNICPHCATEIPPLTKICPNCNRAVNTNETSGDKELFELIDKINGVTRENLSGIRVIRAFNAEKYQEQKFDEANNALTNQQLFNQKVFSLLKLPIIREFFL